MKIMKMAKFSFRHETFWAFFPGLLGILVGGLLYLLRWLFW